MSRPVTLSAAQIDELIRRAIMASMSGASAYPGNLLTVRALRNRGLVRLDSASLTDRGWALAYRIMWARGLHPDTRWMVVSEPPRGREAALAEWKAASREVIGAEIRGEGAGVVRYRSVTFLDGLGDSG